MTKQFFSISGLFFHVVGEGVVNLSRKAENITDKENYIDFRLRLLGEPGKSTLYIFLNGPIPASFCLVSFFSTSQGQM